MAVENSPRATLLYRITSLFFHLWQITDLSEMKNPSYESIRRLYADDNQIDSLLDLEGTEFIQKFEIFHMRRNKLKSVRFYFEHQMVELFHTYALFPKPFPTDTILPAVILS